MRVLTHFWVGKIWWRHDFVLFALLALFASRNLFIAVFLFCRLHLVSGFEWWDFIFDACLTHSGLRLGLAVRYAQSHFGLFIFVFELTDFELARFDKLEELPSHIHLSFDSTDTFLEQLETTVQFWFGLDTKLESNYFLYASCSALESFSSHFVAHFLFFFLSCDTSLSNVSIWIV